MPETLEVRVLRAWYAKDDEEVGRLVEAMAPADLRELSRACMAIAEIAASARVGTFAEGHAARSAGGHEFEGDGLWCTRRGCHLAPSAEVHA